MPRKAQSRPSKLALRPGARGPAVKAFQQNLIELGYPLPRYGADGWYGNETDDAAAVFAQASGLKKAHGISSYALVKLAGLATRAGRALATMPPSVIDYRRRHGGEKRLRRRPWNQVTGITLHQTATCYLPAEGFTQGQFDRAVERVAGIGVNAVALRCGTGVLSNGAEWVMPQAQRVFNESDVGIEVDGWFAGTPDDPDTARDEEDWSFWKPESRPDRKPMGEAPLQTAVTLELIDYFVDLVKSRGGQIKYLHAHRQTSNTRRSDPGEVIWRTIAIPAMEKHGLTPGFDGWDGDPYDFFVPEKSARRGNVWTGRGPGLPIPASWDPKASARY